MRPLEYALTQDPEARRAYLFALWSFGEPNRAALFVAREAQTRSCAEELGDETRDHAALLHRVRRASLAYPLEQSQEEVARLVSSALDVPALPHAEGQRVTPLLSLLARQSRAVRDVVWMTCIMDLPQDQVAVALGLGLARVELLLAAALARLRQAFDTHRLSSSHSLDDSLAALRLLSMRFVTHARQDRSWRHRLFAEVAALRPIAAQVAWFLVPMVLVVAFGEGAIALMLRMLANA